MYKLFTKPEYYYSSSNKHNSIHQEIVLRISQVSRAHSVLVGIILEEESMFKPSFLAVATEAMSHVVLKETHGFIKSLASILVLFGHSVAFMF